MTLDQLLAEIRSYVGVLELAPRPGSEHLEISWSDHFFYYAPDGLVPRNRQPYATIVTKNYPDDVQSRLDDPDRLLPAKHAVLGWALASYRFTRYRRDETRHPRLALGMIRMLSQRLVATTQQLQRDGAA